MLAVKSALLATIIGATTFAQTPSAARYVVDPTPFVELGGDGTTAGPLLTAVLSAIKTAQGFVVGESRGGVLLFFDALGKLVRSVGRPGQGPGEFMGGVFLGQCAGDSLFAWDTRTMRLSVFTSVGTFVRQVPAPGARFACSRSDVVAMLSRPSALAQGRAQGRSGGSGQMASLKVMTASGDSIGGVASVPFGESGMFGAATSIAVRGREVYVGTGREPAIDVYGPQGDVRRRITYAHAPVRVSPAAHARAVDGLLEAMRAGGALRDPPQQRAALLAMPVAEYFPPYREIAVAPNGLVWLLTTQLSDSVAHVRAVRDDGSIAAEADLPIGDTVRLLEAGDDYLLLTYVNGDGDTKVGAFRVRVRGR